MIVTGPKAAKLDQGQLIMLWWQNMLAEIWINIGSGDG